MHNCLIDIRMTNKALKGAVGAYDLSFCEQDCSLVQINTDSFTNNGFLLSLTLSNLHVSEHNIVLYHM